MTTEYGAESERARKNNSTILQALARVGQVTVAERMRVSESKISRFKNGELTEIATFLGALDLKVVPTSARCFRPEFVNALFELAKDRMTTIQQPEELSWD